MRLFVCRWPDGDFSIVYASDEEMAIASLDNECPAAEEATYIPIDEFIAHFRLTDSGEFKLKSLDSGAEAAIREAAYPLIVEAFLTLDRDPSPDEMRILAKKERRRVKPQQVPEPDTEIGKQIKRQTGLPTKLINRMVEEHSKKSLKKLKVKGRRVN